MSGFPIDDNEPTPMEEDIEPSINEEDRMSDSEHNPPIDSATLLKGDVDSVHWYN